MQLNTAPTVKAEVSGALNQGTFNIKTSAKAFSILSSGLYSNKIKAIIRELSCNAVDAIKASGKEGNFYVHLPTVIEPYFSVKDEGIGLNHEEVLRIYTTYFESTKTESNDFIGALGLGSKSPFSYTDNFTITAIKNGTKGVYTAYINDMGVPSIVQLLSQEINEPNGVEVQFQVKEDDFQSFYKEADEVFYFFDTKPICNVTLSGDTASYLKANRIPVETSRKDYEIFASHRSYPPIAKAVMGNIAYPINLNEFPEELSDFHRWVLESSILYFNIGELDITASREELSYIPSTIKAIQDKVKEVSEDFLDFLVEKNKEFDNPYIFDYWFDKNILSKLSYIRASYILNALLKHSSNLKMFDPNFTKGVNISKDLFAKFNLIPSFEWKLNLNNKKENPYAIKKRGIFFDSQKFTHHIYKDLSHLYVVLPSKDKLPSRKTLDKVKNLLVTPKTVFGMEFKPKLAYILIPLDETKEVDLEGFKKALKLPDVILYKEEDLPLPIKNKVTKPKDKNVPTSKPEKVKLLNVEWYAYTEKKMFKQTYEDFENAIKSSGTKYYLADKEGKPNFLKNVDNVRETLFLFFKSHLCHFFLKTKFSPLNFIYLLDEKKTERIKGDASWIDFDALMQEMFRKHIKSSLHTLAFTKAINRPYVSIEPIDPDLEEEFKKTQLFQKTAEVFKELNYISELKTKCHRYTCLSLMDFSGILETFWEELYEEFNIHSIVQKYKEVMENYPLYPRFFFPDFEIKPQALHYIKLEEFQLTHSTNHS